MIEQWLNAAGLAFDFVGIILLAYEWQIQLKADEKEAEIVSRENMFKPHPNTQQKMQEANPHHAVFEHMKEQRKFSEQMGRARTARGTRRSLYTVALVLVAAGFLLQFLGSWPGGLGS